MKISKLKELFQAESAVGVLLILAALLAIAAENSFAKPVYDALISTPVEIRIGEFEIAKPLLL